MTRVLSFDLVEKNVVVLDIRLSELNELSRLGYSDECDIRLNRPSADIEKPEFETSQADTPIALQHYEPRRLVMALLINKKIGKTYLLAKAKYVFPKGSPMVFGTMVSETRTAKNSETVANLCSSLWVLVLR